MNFYFAKEYAERAYLMVAVLENKLADGMFISIDDPSITFRQYNDGSENLLILEEETIKLVREELRKKYLMI